MGTSSVGSIYVDVVPRIQPAQRQSKLAVIGDRQDGKTYLAELLAVTEAFKGQDVLYECDYDTSARMAINDCKDLADQFLFPVKYVRITNGDLRMEFFSGGHIWFRPVRGRNGGRIIVPDIHILDNCPHMEGHPLAKRVFRTVLR